MVLELIEKIDYDIWKEYKNDPEYSEYELPKLIEIVKGYLK